MAQSENAATTNTSARNNTVYNRRFGNDLIANGMFEQQCIELEPPEQGFAPRVPKNYDIIRNAIQKDRPDTDDPSPQEYHEYMQLIFNTLGENWLDPSLQTHVSGLRPTLQTHVSWRRRERIAKQARPLTERWRICG